MKANTKKLTAVLLLASLTISQSTMAFNDSGGITELGEVVAETKKFSKTSSYLIGTGAAIFSTVMTVAKQSIPLALAGTVITVGAFKYPGMVSSGAMINLASMNKGKNLTEEEKLQLQFELAHSAEKLNRMLDADPELKQAFKELAQDPTLDTSGATPIGVRHAAI